MALPIIICILILIVSLIALVKGADWFTQGAEEVGGKLKMPQFVIGVLIVSIGTSLPELASSIAAVLAGSSEIVLGNVVGSNIANTLFVLGLGALLAGGLATKWKRKQIDLTVLSAATLLLILMILDGSFGRIDGAIMIAGFAAYIIHMLRQKEQATAKSDYKGSRSILLLAIGLLFVVGGAKYLIDAVIAISTVIGISTAVIGSSVVAFGTSLPEAIVTVVAAVKGKREMAFGNIIGSNIFNILFIMGVGGLIGPLVVDPQIAIFGLSALVASTILLWIVTRDHTIRRWEGVALLALYGIFILKLFL